jgi:hypothetical protein
VSRLLKSDLVAVLAELQRQEQVFLCMKVRHFFSHFVCVDENMLKKKKFQLFGGVAVFPLFWEAKTECNRAYWICHAFHALW